jgi:hypothetical protein
MYFIILIP